MKLKKIFIIVAAIFVAGLGNNVCSAQVISPTMAPSGARDQLFGGSVEFSNSSSNKIMAVGSTNFVPCRIRNSSTNRIAFDDSPQSFLNPITNGRVDYDYGHRLELATYPKTPEKHFVEAGETCDWNEPIIIGSSIKPGHYHLVILKGVFIPASNERVAIIFSISPESQDIEVVQ